MEKLKKSDIIKTREEKAKNLLRELNDTDTRVQGAASAANRLASSLREKEKREKAEKAEQERKERFLELIESDKQLAVHVGGDGDEAAEQSAAPSPTAEQHAAEAYEPPAIVESAAPAQPVAKAETAHNDIHQASVEVESPRAVSTSVADAPAATEKPSSDEEVKKTTPQPERRPMDKENRQSDRPSYQQGQGDRPPYQQRQGDKQPYQQGQGDRPPYQQRQGDRPPYQQRQGDRPPYQQRQGDRPPYQQRQGDRPPYQQRQGDRPPYQQRQGDKPPYQQRQGDRPSFDRSRTSQDTRFPAAKGFSGASSRPQEKRSSGSSFAPSIEVATKERVSNYDPNKSAYAKNYEKDKKAKSKKTIMKETPSTGAWDDDSPMGNRRRPKKQPVPVKRLEPIKIEKAILTSETVTVKELSEKIGKPAAEIIKKLFILGNVVTINQEIDFDTCALVASDFDIELELQVAKTYEEVLTESAAEELDDETMLAPRPPVVTIMGHVDHGKTSLLDAIRHSSVTAGEAGGITQHIGAYTVTLNGRSITFIDTPGHEAFTSMRARGAQVTDIVILVVAADDGIMPQTIEAINHSKAAGVPIIVAINKMDRESANSDRVKQQLTEYGLVSEEWGGETICVPVSAKTKLGIDSLLEMILLQADVLELKANPNRLAKGTIIEAQLHKGRGPIATVLVQNGTLKIGDPIVAGVAYGRVRAMTDDKGRPVKEAGPSQPVEVLGFSEVPSAGDVLNVSEVDKLSRQVADERKNKQKAEMLKSMTKVSLDDLFNQISQGQVKDLNIIVKADVQGSVEAVKQALEKLSNEEVRVCCIHGGVGAITNTDVMFASASNAIIIGFNVRPDAGVRVVAEREKVDLRLYRIIYNAIEDVQNAMKGMFAPVFAEVELGRVSVRSTFKVSNVGTIAGAYVQEGKVLRNAQVRIVRDGVVIHEGKIASLKRFKDDAKEVASGYECGIMIESFNDIKEGDIIEVFKMEEQER